jgi:hypothetical protein
VRSIEGAAFVCSDTGTSISLQITFSNATCIELTEDLS